MRKLPVIIDCDPGADDGVGILLALNSPRLSVLGITTVCGNAPVTQTSLNATKICILADRKEMRVYCGAGQPLKRSLEFTDIYSGKDGLCDTGLEENRKMIGSLDAVTYLQQMLLQSSEPVTIITMAGFTNIAQLLSKAPRIRHKIKEIVAASGYFGFHKEVCRAEWNILVDPEAAEIVYDSGVPLRAIGLDVTAMLKAEFIAYILEKKKGRIADFIRQCVAYNIENKLHPHSLLADGMAVAAVVEPEIAKYVSGTVKINPARSDDKVMEFFPGEGHIRGAYTYHFNTYLELIRELIKE